MPIVYTGGTFDLLHPGHLVLLSRCRELAGPDGRVVVSLNSDAFVRRYKGITTTHSFGERRTMLRGTRYVDLVVLNIGDEDSRPAIETVMPDVIAIGMDWAQRDYHAQMGFTPEWLDERGIRLAYVDLLAGVSSTVIRGRLRA